MATETWIATQYAPDNTNLDDPANWSGGRVPGKGDTAIIDRPLLAEQVNIGKGSFLPSTLIIGQDTDVTFTSNRVYHIPTLDVGFATGVGFDGGLIAGTVNVAGALDVSGMIGSDAAATTSQSAADHWSETHGFGRHPLSAVIGQLNELLTPPFAIGGFGTAQYAAVEYFNPPANPPPNPQQPGGSGSGKFVDSVTTTSGVPFNPHWHAYESLFRHIFR